MPRTKIVLALITLTAAFVAAASAQAATWTALSSGTTETINALDYRGAGAYFYGTSTGKLFKNGAQATGTTGGQPINDLAMSPDGTKGIAVGSGGKIMHTTDGGATWAAAAPALSYPNTNCSGTSGGTAPVTEDLTAVSWGDATTAYIVGRQGPKPSPLLKSTDGGQNWTDVNRSSSGNCLMPSGTDLTDVVALQGTTTVWFLTQSFGARYVSFDAAGTLTSKPGSAINHFAGQPRIGVSPEQPDWVYVADREDDNGGLNFYSSTDSGNTFERIRPTTSDFNTPAIYGIATAGQTMVAAGSAGSIYLSVDAVNRYTISDTGAFKNTNWKAVSLASPTSAAVAGQGGVIATTTDANTTPDLVAPSGAINDPGTVKALEAKAFTATLTDNAGGSGIDPASIRWSAVPVGLGASPVTGTGNPATLTFPSAGLWTVTVAFKDLAGNGASATLGVTVDKATPADTPRTDATRTTTTTTNGAKVTFSTPKACVAAGKSFKVTLSWKKLKKKGNGFIKITRVDFYIAGKVVKKDLKAPFAQRLTVKAGTVSGSTVKLRARAFMKVRSGKRPTKSLNTTVKTC